MLSCFWTIALHSLSVASYKIVISLENKNEVDTLMQSIKIGNKKMSINDQQLANAVVEEYVIKKRVRHNFNGREEEKTEYFAHV